MGVNVRIPPALQNLTDGQAQVNITASTVRDCIANLDRQYPGMQDRLLDAKGVRRFVNIYVNDEDVRFLNELETRVQEGDEISIVPAISGS